MSDQWKTTSAPAATFVRIEIDAPKCLAAIEVDRKEHGDRISISESEPGTWSDWTGAGAPVAEVIKALRLAGHLPPLDAEEQ